MTELATPEQTLVGVKTVKKANKLVCEIGWNSGQDLVAPVQVFFGTGFFITKLSKNTFF